MGVPNQTDFACSHLNLKESCTQPAQMLRQITIGALLKSMGMVHIQEVTGENVTTNAQMVKIYTLNYSCNCKKRKRLSHSSHVIKCIKCLLDYVGRTEDTLKDRCMEHRIDITNKTDTTLSKHFIMKGHSFKDMRYFGIEKSFVKTHDSSVLE